MDRIVDRILNLQENQLEYDELLAVPANAKKSQFINATLKRFPNLEWYYLDDSGTEIADVLKNCPPQPPHRIVSILRPYTETWIESNPTLACGAYWAADEAAAYMKIIDAAELSGL